MTRIEGVILPGAGEGWFGPESKSWTPSEDDVRTAEPVVLERIGAEEPALFARLGEYLCQFIGIIWEGRRRIYFNFFHRQQDGADVDWRTEGVFVMDGGDDYFHAVYDVDSGECVAFYVNGEA